MTCKKRAAQDRRSEQTNAPTARKYISKKISMQILPCRCNFNLSGKTSKIEGLHALGSVTQLTVNFMPNSTKRKKKKKKMMMMKMMI